MMFLRVSLAAMFGALLAASAHAACPTMITGPQDPSQIHAIINSNNSNLMAAGNCPAGGFTTSPRNIHTCGRAPTAATFGTDTTPVATETYIAEVFVPGNMTVTGVAVLNGSAVAGNMVVGLANSAGAVVASSASTAASGTAAYQLVPFSTAYYAVGPATYYVLLQNNNTSNRFRSQLAPGACGAAKKTGETYGTLTTITPPTTFTADLGPVATLY